MTRPRIHILALGGTIATRADATGAMQMGLGADDLVAAVPLLADIAEIRAETVSRVGSHSLTFTQIAALALKIEALVADGAQGIVVTQGTDTLEETSFLLDLLLDLDVPVVVTAAMRNPALTSPDGPGNLLAAVRVAANPWVRARERSLGVVVVLLDEVYAATDVLKIHPTRINAFASPQTGPVAALAEDRVVPLSLPVRSAMMTAHAVFGVGRAAKLSKAKPAPVALFWTALDEPGTSGRSLALGATPFGLSRRLAGGNGRWPHPGIDGASCQQAGGGAADRRRRSRGRQWPASSPYLWRSVVGNCVAQIRPDLGRASASAQGRACCSRPVCAPASTVPRWARSSPPGIRRAGRSRAIAWRRRSRACLYAIAGRRLRL